MERITKEEFEALDPFHRGWAVYMAGAREDQPNVPQEDNPYPDGSEEASEWDRGQQRACIEILDTEG